MFGYIKPLESELKVKEAEFYKAIYCGLCRTLGKETGIISRLTLSYDLVFLSLIRAASANEEYKLSSFRCCLKCTKKRCRALTNESLSYSARVGALLSYYKALDDYRDSHGAKKIKAALFIPFAASMRKKAIRKNPQSLPEEEIRCAIASLSKLEKEKCAIPDMCADCSGELLASVFSHGIDSYDEGKAILLSKIGRHIGRYIYLLDSADDYEKDSANKNYNPFIESGSLDKEALRCSLDAELEMVERLLDRIDFADPGIENIVRNTITYGAENTIDRVIDRQKRKKKKEK